MNARIGVGSREVTVDLERPISLAIDLDFSERQPRHFGAPLASSRPFVVAGFPGSVEHGASCNCNTITLIPHCNGTHTECVGHLTREPLDAHRVTPTEFLPALLVSVEAVAAELAGESTEPAAQSGDLLITRSAIEKSWPASAPFEPRALVIRTMPPHQGYPGKTPPYLSREAAMRLVERGIEHLVIDLPSIDRSHDEGRLTAHRIFFGLPGAAVALAQSTRPRSTITELAHIPDTAADGPYLLALQVPAIGGDAVPSRPLLYPLLSA